MVLQELTFNDFREIKLRKIPLHTIYNCQNF